MAKRSSSKDTGEHAKAKQKIAMEDCFLIMPISDPSDYKSGHFKRVRDDLFRPACEAAGFRAIRADETMETNVIQLDILKKLIEAPIAICDLSTRNPNVMFELGIRQAFDKPVVLVQEVDTPRIFDISGIRIIDYRRELLYREVIQDQRAIAEALRATRNPQPGSINSLIQLLSLAAAAKLDESAAGDVQGMLRLILSEVSKNSQALQVNSARRFAPPPHTKVPKFETGFLIELDFFTRICDHIKSCDARNQLLPHPVIDDFLSQTHRLEHMDLPPDMNEQVKSLVNNTMPIVERHMDGKL